MFIQLAHFIASTPNVLRVPSQPPPLSQRVLAFEPAHALNTLLAQKNRIPSKQRREEITC